MEQERESKTLFLITFQHWNITIFWFQLALSKWWFFNRIWIWYLFHSSISGKWSWYKQLCCYWTRNKPFKWWLCWRKEIYLWSTLYPWCTLNVFHNFLCPYLIFLSLSLSYLCTFSLDSLSYQFFFKFLSSSSLSSFFPFLWFMKSLFFGMNVVHEFLHWINVEPEWMKKFVLLIQRAYFSKQLQFEKLQPCFMTHDFVLQSTKKRCITSKHFFYSSYFCYIVVAWKCLNWKINWTI